MSFDPVKSEGLGDLELRARGLRLKEGFGGQCGQWRL